MSILLKVQNDKSTLYNMKPNTKIISKKIKIVNRNYFAVQKNICYNWKKSNRLNRKT